MACPDDNTLVAMIEHALDPVRFAEIEVHLDTCEHCRRVVAESGGSSMLARGTLGPPPTEADDQVPVRSSQPVFEGRYEIERVLGQGGMGKVYLARDKTLGREVALKVHRASSGVDRLHREALAMAKLAHPNAVTVFEVGTVDDRLYVAMEYVRGTTLRGWLNAAKRPWRQILAKLVEAGQGLAAAHAAGLIHRDFKPENILVGDDGRPRVGDFGLARVEATEPSEPSSPDHETDAKVTETGTVLGTPAYMAPEQIAGEVVDARADQFAFCVVAWEALYGVRPFVGKTLGALAAAIEDRKLQLPARTDVPDRVRVVLKRGLAAKAIHRHANMPALLAALQDAAAPRTRRTLAYVALGTVVVGGVTVFGATTLVARQHEAACVTAAAEIRDLLAPEVRTQMQQAFAATGSPIHASSFERTAEVLAKHADNLARAAEAACRSSDEPAVLADARGRCLADETEALRSMIEVMTKADAATVARAASAAWSMWSAAPCADSSALLARRATTPGSPDTAKELAAVRALHVAGRYEEGEPRAAKLLETARARRDTDLELATLLALAELRTELAAPDKVVPLLDDALALAERLGRDLEAANALGQLANVSGVMLHDYAAAHRHVQLAFAKLERLGDGNPALRGGLHGIEGQVFLDENRQGDAETAIRRSITELEKAYGPDHPEVGSAFGTLSQVQRSRGDAAGGLASSERALAILERAFGAEHPSVGGAQMNLATSLISLGRRDEARTLLARADAIFVRAFGDKHPVRAAIHGNLGELELAAGKLDAALAAYKKAVEILEAVEGPESPGTSGARRDVARVLSLQDKLDDAIAEQMRAIAILEKLGPDGESRLVGALVEHANFELTRDRFAPALPLAERALGLALARPADADPDEVAIAKFLLARCLVGTKGNLARAKQLFDDARAQLKDARAAELDAWRAGAGAVLR